MPLEADIGRAYESYFTHSTDDPQAQNRLFQIWKQVARIYQLLLRPIGIYHLRRRASFMYLDSIQPGRLLDVGCGDGYWLAQMRKHGWQVEGQELDPKAAEMARRAYGLTIHVGDLSTLALPANTFDAIVLSHVIEHTHDPIALLQQCKQLLKAGGSLVVLTPNLASYGYRRFRDNWVALDPPRHLMLFSVQTLRKVAERVGFSRYQVLSTPVRAQFIAMASFDILHTGRHALDAIYTVRQLMRAVLFEWQAWAAYRVHDDCGDECVLEAVK